MGRTRAKTRSAKGKERIVEKKKTSFFAWTIIGLLIFSVFAYVLLQQMDDPFQSTIEINGFSFRQSENLWEISRAPTRDFVGSVFFTLPYGYEQYLPAARFLLEQQQVYISLNPNLEISNQEIYSSHEILRSFVGETLFFRNINAFPSISEERALDTELEIGQQVVNCASNLPVIIFEYSNTTSEIIFNNTCIQLRAQSPFEMAQLTDMLRFALLQ